MRLHDFSIFSGQYYVCIQSKSSTHSLKHSLTPNHIYIYSIHYILHSCILLAKILYTLYLLCSRFYSIFNHHCILTPRCTIQARTGVKIYSGENWSQEAHRIRAAHLFCPTFVLRVAYFFQFFYTVLLNATFVKVGILRLERILILNRSIMWFSPNYLSSRHKKYSMVISYIPSSSNEVP